MAAPVSNLLAKRDLLPVAAGGDELKKASPILQEKCADCHTPGLTVYPFYANLPGVHEIIENDIEESRTNFLLAQDQLTGKTSLSKKNLALLQSVIDTDEMPPLKYKLFHWNSSLTADEKDCLTSWIRSAAQQANMENPQ
ncbi:MAG: heme-binding domain-containing protein [Cyanobacteria bacterium]|nr:heme-binding domain-containing protein [Cyanobacteriota bacterium]